jgi:signal transduction histidine kinase
MSTVLCQTQKHQENDDLRERVELLQTQLRRAQRLATVGTMAAMVAHEFNNILTPILNYAQMAKGGDAAMTQKAVHHALEGSQRAVAVCRALLDLSGNNNEDTQEVGLLDLVDHVLEAMARDPAKDGIVLTKKIPEKLRLTTRPSELAQVILNLLLNARCAVLEKGRGHQINISAQKSGGKVIIRVADTGIGIAPANIEAIFEPFFTTKGDSGGSGLGLAVCQHIVQSLGGELSVRSELGKGTVFTIALPQAGAGAPGRKAIRTRPALKLSV